MEYKSPILQGRAGFRWKLSIPVLLALVGTSLLVGCIYLPIPEHRVESQQTDFRPLLLSGRHPPAIRPGIQRAAVIATLGRPQYESKDAVGYRLYTESGLWVWPLCFQASSAKRTEYGINLTFDGKNALIHVESVTADASQLYFLQMLPKHVEAIPFEDAAK